MTESEEQILAFV